jgi:hypothetical protein
MRGFSLPLVCLDICAMYSHQTSDFCEYPQLSMYKGAIGLAYEISPMYRGSLLGLSRHEHEAWLAHIIGQCSSPEGHRSRRRAGYEDRTTCVS